MAAPQNAPLAPFLTLGDGMQIRITALDAVSGATVAGVVVSNVSIDVDPGQGNEPPVVLGFSSAYSQGDQAA